MLHVIVLTGNDAYYWFNWIIWVFLIWFSSVDSVESVKLIQLNHLSLFIWINWIGWVDSTESVELIQLDDSSWFNWISWAQSTVSDAINLLIYFILQKISVYKHSSYWYRILSCWSKRCSNTSKFFSNQFYFILIFLSTAITSTTAAAGGVYGHQAEEGRELQHHLLLWEMRCWKSSLLASYRNLSVYYIFKF